MSITAVERPRADKQVQQAIPANPQALLQAVLQANQGTKDPRTREVLDALIRHIHAFASEVKLTYDELHKGLDFMVRVGQATGPEKHEGILLADILGLATHVLLLDAKAILAAGGTEPALIGPFWRANQPLMSNGVRIASEDTVGSPLFVQGKVVSTDGKPIVGARIETWQAAPGGLYENQDPEQEDMNLRAVFETDANGRFWFESVRPSGYGVPIDGPCGELLALQGRNHMRPAHLHFIAIAPGHKVLTTQIFDSRDPFAFSDAAFGAVGSLLRDFQPDSQGHFHLDVELCLEPGETRLPTPPLP
ncbi:MULTISPECIES: dioxygenase [Comamonas]|uniref:dioxygenase family protein n=1 Tax=Comamonas TaxID=283 RepID=UPI0001DA643B|nr:MULTISPECIES: dioxygenase [Comamonas]EFI59385.1 protocatechuate 3,4-dioxygenase beta subunit [Comamonas thiooxydans]TFF62903.1 protocatechuate 3,4-dioxygenase [Comamonas sp. A23]